MTGPAAASPTDVSPEPIVRVTNVNGSGVAVANNPSNIAQVGGATTAAGTAASGNKALGVMVLAPPYMSDVALAARTVTGNSGAIADDFGASLAASIAVTAVTGTTPTLDIALQESYDAGLSWVDIWHVERITAVLSVPATVPAMRIGGVRRWVWTVGGTTPSFTFQITTTRGADGAPVLRRFFDRSLVATATGVSANFFDMGSCRQFAMSAKLSNAGGGLCVCATDLGDVTTSTNNYIAVPAMGNTIPYRTVLASYMAKFARARVVTADATAVMDYICIMGCG